MTGSAFARYELRGAFHMLLLRALSGAEWGGFRGGDCVGIEPPLNQRRMTGSALARYELRGTFRN